MPDTIEKAIKRGYRAPARIDDQSRHDAHAEHKSDGEPAPRNEPIAAQEPRAQDSTQNPQGRTKRSTRINRDRLRDAGMLSPDMKRSGLTEEYRTIKRPLLMNAEGRGLEMSEHSNLIMVTSSHPGEGKTFTALNLALSVASERDRTVLLVDADVVKPSLDGFFQSVEGPGLVDFLLDERLDLFETLVETDIPKLTLLPAGSRHHLSTEILASERMRRLANEMSTRYADRIVIFDSPPLLATTEAAVVASLVGQVVIVVEAERTRQGDVEEAVQLLNSDATIGFVLNKTNRPKPPSYYHESHARGSQ